jgi:Domain of unknown function (DUF6398)
MTLKSMSVPKAMQARFDEIVKLTNAYCASHLNEEYAELIRKAIAAVSRKRPSPLDKGKAEVWACSFIHAIGTNTFLFDRSHAPYVAAADLCNAFGVASSTSQNKSKLIRDMLHMSQFDHNWCLPSQLENSPVVWMIRVNGFFMDIRHMQREVQVMAFEKGLIPYVPADQPPATAGGKITP